MGFCTQCGYRFGAPANFCPRCGAPNVTPARPPDAVPGGAVEVEERTVAQSDLVASVPPTPPPDPPYAAPPSPHPDPYAAPQPVPVGASASAPFVWAGPAIRAAVGVGALTLSWVLDWSAHHPGAYRLASLAILLAIVGGCVGLVPGLRTTLPNAPTIGILALAPLAALTVYTLLRSLVPSPGGGMEARDRPGAGMALAAVGAVLVVQALLPGAPAALGVLWKRVCVGLLGACGLWGLVSAVDLFRRYFSSFDSLGLFGAALLLTALVLVLTPVWFAVQIARDRSPDWAAGMILALALVAGFLLTAIADGTLPGDIGAPLTLFFVGLAAGSAGPVAARMRPALVGADRWFQAVAGVLVLCAAGLGLTTLLLVGALTESYGSKGGLALGIVVSLAGCVGAIVCRQLLVDHAPTARVATVVWAGALTLIATIVQIASDNAHLVAGAFTREYVFTMLPGILLPLAILLSLTVPASVRLPTSAAPASAAPVPAAPASAEPAGAADGQPARGGALSKGVLSGIGMIVASVALFGVCSLVQHAYGSSMFETSYSDPGFVGGLLITITFWPGWFAIVALAGRGLLRIVTGALGEN